MSGIIIWILAFMFLVVIHEFGHFATAKKFGVKVLEFGIGIPPKLFKFWKDKTGTEYTINLIPLGWFVRLKWEDPDDKEDFWAKDSLISASFFAKVCILIGGVVMNFLFTWIVFVIAFWVGFQPMQIISSNFINVTNDTFIIANIQTLAKEWLIKDSSLSQSPIIWEVMSGGLWSKIWFESWDILLKINNIPSTNLSFADILRDNIGQNIYISTKRWQNELLLTWTCAKDNCVLWVTIANSPDLSNIYIHKPGLQAFGYATRELQNQTILSYKILAKVFGGLIHGDFKSSVSKLSGPAWAIKMWSNILDKQPIIQYLLWMAMISLSLAIFNILPIPALDGGRLLWFLIQKIFWLRGDRYFVIEWYLNILFFVLMMGLGIYILLKDLVMAWWINIPFFG